MNKTITILLIIAVGLLGVIAFNSTSEKAEKILGFGGYDLYTASSTEYTTTAGEATVLTPRNETRGWMTITNMTATATYLALNATTTPNTAPGVTDAEYTILIPASGMYTFGDENGYTGAVIASSSAAVTLRVTEVY